MSAFAAAVERVEPSATVRMADLASKLKYEGVDVLDFSAGDPDFDSPEHVTQEAIESLQRGETHYPPTPGVFPLREAIATKLTEENGLDVAPEEVYVTPGSKQGLFEVIFTVLREGDETILPNPSWVSYAPMVKLAGGTVNRIDMDPKAGFTLGDVDLAEHVSDDTRLMILNSPANPTGAVFPREDLEEIRDLAVEHDFYVLSDEIYEKFVYESEHISIGSMDGMENRTITLNGFSKNYAMAGWRIGYFTAPEDLLDSVGKVQSHSVTSATTFAQYGAVQALEGPQDRVHEMKETFQHRRDVLVEELAQRGIEIPRPGGAYNAFIPVDSEDDLALCEKLLEEEHVALTPGQAFGRSGYVRLAFTTDAEDIREGIDRISDYLQSP